MDDRPAPLDTRAFARSVMDQARTLPRPTPARALAGALRRGSLRDAVAAIWVAWHLTTAGAGTVRMGVRVRSMGLVLGTLLAVSAVSFAAAATAHVIANAAIHASGAFGPSANEPAVPAVPANAAPVLAEDPSPDTSSASTPPAAGPATVVGGEDETTAEDQDDPDDRADTDDQGDAGQDDHDRAGDEDADDADDRADRDAKHDEDDKRQPAPTARPGGDGDEDASDGEGSAQGDDGERGGVESDGGVQEESRSGDGDAAVATDQPRDSD